MLLPNRPIFAMGVFYPGRSHASAAGAQTRVRADAMGPDLVGYNSAVSGLSMVFSDGVLV